MVETSKTDDLTASSAIDPSGARAVHATATDYDAAYYAGHCGETYLRVASITDPLPQRYDLITCIEVVEHLVPTLATEAMATIYAATDDVLFTSTPFDYGEETQGRIAELERDLAGARHLVDGAAGQLAARIVRGTDIVVPANSRRRRALHRLMGGVRPRRDRASSGTDGPTAA